MANPQTTETIAHEMFGAVKIEVSEDGITYTDFGAVNGAVFTEELVISTVETQNAEDRDLITDHTGTVEFSRIELFNQDALDIVRDGIDTVENIAGTPVAGATQDTLSGAWGYNDFILIENQNGDGSIITVNSVTGSVDSTLTVDDDYFVGQNDAGKWGVFVVDGTTFTTEAQDIEIDYDYTPNATIRRWSGGLTDLNDFYTRLTNTEVVEGVSKTTQWVFFKTNLSAGETFEYKKYNDEDTRVESPVAFNCKKDTSRVAGKQLYYVDRITN